MGNKLLITCFLLLCQFSFAQPKDIDFKTAKKRGDITFKKKEYAHAIENYRLAIAINPSCMECQEGIKNAKVAQRKELLLFKEVRFKRVIENQEPSEIEKPKMISKPMPIVPEVLNVYSLKGLGVEIGKRETTQKEWENYCLNNELTFPNIPDKLKGSNYPIVNISYLEAKQYTMWISKITGEYYDLPTKQEWELARGRFSESKEDGWFYENADRKTHEVGTKSPNQYGLFDMEGNVSEWVNDWYHKDLLFEISEDFATSISEENRTRLVCGCSTRDNIKYCDKIKNMPMEAGVSKEYIGFRIIKRDINE